MNIFLIFVLGCLICAAFTEEKILLGGIQPISESELPEEALEGIRKYVKEYNSMHYLFPLMKFGKFIKGTMQVFQGVYYEFRIQLVETSCRNKPENRDIDLEQCPPVDNGWSKICDITVWSRSWLPEEKDRLSVGTHWCETESLYSYVTKR